MSKYALLDYSLTASRSDNETGYSNALSLSRDATYYSFGLMSKFNDRKFKTLGYTDYIDLTKMDNLVYLSLFKVPFWDSLNLNFVERKYYQTSQSNNRDTQIINVGFFKNINNKSTFSMSYFKNLTADKDNGFTFSYSYNFDNAKRLYIDHDTNADTSRLRYVENSVLAKNFDYVLGANRSGSDYSYNAFGLWKSAYGDLAV